MSSLGKPRGTNGDHWDEFFYPILTLIIDSYILALIAILFSGVDFGTILVEAIIGNMFLKLFCFWEIGSGRYVAQNVLK